MQNQRGFVGVGVLIAIVVGVALLGGGAYYVMYQQSPSQTMPEVVNNTPQLISEEQALALAQNIVTKDLKNAVSLACLTFSANKEGIFITYNVARKMQCVPPDSDPPVIPSIRIDRISGAVSIQSLDGIFRPLDNTQTNSKIYKNTQYGFAFTYPATWVLSETKNGLVLTSPHDGVSRITFFSSPEGTSSIGCPVSSHELECKTIENPNGVLYARTINTGQLQYAKQRQLNGWFLGSNGHVQMSAVLTNTLGAALPFSSDTTVVFDGVLQSITSLPTTPASVPQNPTNIPGWKTYEGAGFEVQYPESTFVLFSITTNLSRPYDFNTYSGVKLISLARASNIGQSGCMYGESGISTICSAGAEAGMEFIQVNDSVQNLTINLSSKSAVTILGRQSIKYSAGAEGDGFDTYFIPLSPARTLVIKRTYRYVDGDFPQQTLFDQVIATLVIK